MGLDALVQKSEFKSWTASEWVPEEVILAKLIQKGRMNLLLNRVSWIVIRGSGLLEEVNSQTPW